MPNECGRWKLIDSIGEGGQSWVHLAEDKNDELKGQFALKRLKNPAKTRRFKNEILARQKLDNPRIPRIVDHNLSDPTFLVEDYIRGGTLAKNRKLFEGDVLKTLKYFRQIAQVVESAHKCDPPVVHRDLKPENILYSTEHDEFFVTDFGICFIIDPDNDERFTLLEEQVGDRHFIAPELERGRVTDIKPTSDIYSLGKLLYWMLSNKYLHREAIRDPEYDLTVLLRDVQLERINEVFDVAIVENVDARCKNIHEVDSMVAAAADLMKHNYNITDRRIQQHCIYCGIGKYKIAAEYRPSSHVADAQHFENGKAKFAPYGITIDNSHVHHVLSICDRCGNMQQFYFGEAGNPWRVK